MCGIIAISGNTSKNLDDTKIGAMLSSLSKRGPDDKGFMRIGDTILGQTRLSIVDIAGGHQPMKDAEHPLTIVFNGEIYGYKETRANLEALGHSFTTNSDTEVILKTYAHYGSTCVDHLDGMFAFAIWDERTQELFIARDRFGKKPFYYSWRDGIFLGASEIKALFGSGLIKGKIDTGALDDYLQLGYIPPWKTIYSNIHTLPPAHAGIVKNGKVETWRYWKLKKKNVNISYDDAKTTIKKLFDDAVRKRMVADVEIGSFLSGGVDSTLVTTYAQKYSPRPIKTFVLGYGEYKNELPFALQASKKIGTEHYPLEVKNSSMEELRAVIRYFDEPHADSSDFPQHIISQLASSKIKVALSGDGADEIFMGYGWYQKYWHTPIYKRIFKTPFSLYKKVTRLFSEKERGALLGTNVSSDNNFGKELSLRKCSETFDKINVTDLSLYLPGQLLVKIDRSSMMHSLEVRCPFLDTALVEFVYNLPIAYKMNKNKNKIILKDILSEIMPKNFVERRKQGFGAPLQDWFTEKSTRTELERIVCTDKHPVYSYINKEALRAVFEASYSQGKSSTQKAWSLLCLCLWFEIHHKYHE